MSANVLADDKQCGNYVADRCGTDDPTCVCPATHAHLWRSNIVENVFSDIQPSTSASKQCHSCVQCCTTWTSRSEQEHAMCPFGMASVWCPLNNGKTYMVACGTDCNCKTCMAGEYVSAEPAYDSDRECRLCSGNTYSTTANAVVCTEQVTCANGQYIEYPEGRTPTTSKGVCKSCPDGKYMQSEQHRNRICLDHTPCGKGQQFTAYKATASSCTACNAGTYMDEAGHFKEACKRQVLCGKGNRISTVSLQERSTCTACAAGKYQDEFLHRIASCKTQAACGKGTQASAALATMRSTCTACKPGKYQDTLSHSITACKPQLTCSRGEYFVAMSNDMERECMPCSNDTYQDSSDHYSHTCKVQPTCGAGFLISEDSFNHDAARECSACPEFTYQTRTNHRNTACTEQPMCNPGEFYNAGGVGNSTMATGPAVCTSCEEDAYQNASQHRIAKCLPRKAAATTESRAYTTNEPSDNSTHPTIKSAGDGTSTTVTDTITMSNSIGDDGKQQDTQASNNNKSTAESSTETEDDDALVDDVLDDANGGSRTIFIIVGGSVFAVLVAAYAGFVLKQKSLESPPPPPPPQPPAQQPHQQPQLQAQLQLLPALDLQPVTARTPQEPYGDCADNGCSTVRRVPAVVYAPPAFNFGTTPCDNANSTGALYADIDDAFVGVSLTQFTGENDANRRGGDVLHEEPHMFQRASSSFKIDVSQFDGSVHTSRIRCGSDGEYISDTSGEVVVVDGAVDISDRADTDDVSQFDGLGKVRLIKMCRERSLDHTPFLNDLHGLKHLLLCSTDRSTSGQVGGTSVRKSVASNNGGHDAGPESADAAQQRESQMVIPVRTLSDAVFRQTSDV